MFFNMIKKEILKVQDKPCYLPKSKLLKEKLSAVDELRNLDDDSGFNETS